MTLCFLSYLEKVNCSPGEFAFDFIVLFIILNRVNVSFPTLISIKQEYQNAEIDLPKTPQSQVDIALASGKIT